MSRLFVVALFTFIVSASTFAKCTVEFYQPRDRAFSTTFITEKTYKKILNFLANKGYEVITEKAQDKKFHKFP